MKKILPTLSIIFLIIGYAILTQKAEIASPSTAQITISEARQTHILYGDKTGGGHIHGAGKPCKSEFPPDWNKDKILNTTKRIAANNNIHWRQEQNGYHVGEQMIEGVNVRVVLGREKNNVITAYPTNVERNPCPANDN